MKVAIIGGGAAGLMAAYFCAEGGADTTLFEKNEKLGKKIYITGKGRCNITNVASADVQDFLNNVVTNNKFLFSSISNFNYYNLCDLCERFGLKLKVERGGRVFPESDKSSDVIKMLERAATSAGVKIKLNSAVTEIKHGASGFVLTVNGQTLNFDRVIICTGGLSYSATGCSGDGHNFAHTLGHTIKPTIPALVAIEVKEKVSDLEGLSLKNVNLTALDENGVAVKSLFGEMLFTKNGVSGPIALSMSSFINKRDVKKLTLEIDLKPKVPEAELEERFIRDANTRPNIDFKNLLKDYLPKSLIAYVLSVVNIEPTKKLNFITSTERKNFVTTLKHLRFRIKKLYDIETAIVTSGGVDTREINPNSMESKLIKGLFFAGELIDVDALTGGFNLHIAFATGRAAGEHAAK